MLVREQGHILSYSILTFFMAFYTYRLIYWLSFGDGGRLTCRQATIFRAIQYRFSICGSVWLTSTPDLPSFRVWSR